MVTPRQLFLVSISALLIGGMPLSAPAQEIQTSKIGVLAFRGAEKAHQRWGAIADYLSRQIPGHRFQVEAYDLEGMDKAVSGGEIDFVLTNPGNYVRLETLFGATRITTLSNLYRGKSYTIYGAVIFTRADRKDIRTLKDLRGHSFMAVSQHAFGGFQMAWYELHLLGIDPFRDLSELRFSGFPQDRIVNAVINREVDVGTVRAETLERMIDENKIRRDDIHIINPRFANEYPFRHSTRLYPEWAFAKLKHADESLAQRVAVALLTQQSDSIASKTSKINGWTIPLDYSRVHETFRQLKIAPYDSPGEISLAGVWREYGHWILLTLFILTLLSITTVYVGRINHRLSLSRSALEKEVEERKLAEEKLARHSDILEETVNQRTLELQAVNLELEQDIQARKEAEEMLRSSELALRQLYEITSATDLSFNRKISALLSLGIEYLHIPNASFMRKEQNEFHIVQNIPAEGSDDVKPETEAVPFCYGLPILAHDRTYGALCFIGHQPLSSKFTLVDQDIMQLMAQWIGGEIERMDAEEKALQHQNEIAHVSRLGTMGEMASGLAHELNQPLTAIANYTRGCVRRLQGQQPDIPSIISAIEHSASEAERAAKIIKRLRDFVSKGNIRKEPVDINDIIHMVMDISAADIARHKVDLRLDLAKGLPSIKADHIQIEQVILNLLRNSIESIQNLPGHRLLELSSGVRGNNIIVSVKDNGPGITTESLDHLFHPFYTTKKQGMGLGLSISRSIIEAHGGQLDYIVENNTAGCRFQFMLPASADDKIAV